MWGGKAGAPRDYEALGVEHPDLPAGDLGRDALLTERGDDEVREADGGGAGAEEEDPLLLELSAGDLEGVDQPGERHAGRALDVVVVAADFVAVAGEQIDRVFPCPVLEVDTAVREHLLHRFHELIHEGVEFLGSSPWPAQPEVEGVVEQRLVIGARVEVNRQQALRRDAGSGCVQL